MDGVVMTIVEVFVVVVAPSAAVGSSTYKVKSTVYHFSVTTEQRGSVELESDFTDGADPCRRETVHDWFDYGLRVGVLSVVLVVESCPLHVVI